MAANITNIPAPRVPFIDERTGLMAREWYRFLLNLFVITGSGSSDMTLSDLAVQQAFDSDNTSQVSALNVSLKYFLAYAARHG